jgi:hypothetical protein
MVVEVAVLFKPFKGSLVSNVEDHVNEIIKKLNPETTLLLSFLNIYNPRNIDEF